jgi:hypothetical protein
VQVSIVGASHWRVLFIFCLQCLNFAAQPISEIDIESGQTAVHPRLVRTTAWERLEQLIPPRIGIGQPRQTNKRRRGQVLETPSLDFPTHPLSAPWDLPALGSVGPRRLSRISVTKGCGKQHRSSRTGARHSQSPLVAPIAICHLRTVSVTNLANSFTSSSVVSKEHIQRTTDCASFQT